MKKVVTLRGQRQCWFQLFRVVRLGGLLGLLLRQLQTFSITKTDFPPTDFNPILPQLRLRRSAQGHILSFLLPRNFLLLPNVKEAEILQTGGDSSYKKSSFAFELLECPQISQYQSKHEQYDLDLEHYCENISKNFCFGLEAIIRVESFTKILSLPAYVGVDIAFNR